MDDKTSERKVVPPPYVSFKSFRNFSDRFKVAMPNKIDRSLMSTLSGAQQGQLLGAFNYLKLITEHGTPTEQFVRWVKSEGAERQKAWREIVIHGYPFLFKSGVDMTSATPKELADLFVKAGTSGDTVRKCFSFFIVAAKEAGIALSPYVKSAPRVRSSGQRGPRKNALAQSSDPNGASTTSIEGMGWSQMLLSKFPSFDPAWSDEVKQKWFEAFDKLMEKAPPVGTKSAIDEFEEEEG